MDALEAVHVQWRRGALDPRTFDPYVTRAREAWARLSGVNPQWVATGSTVSGCVGLVAASLPAGAQVLVADGEFTSVTFPFLVQCERGVSVREVPLERLAELAVDCERFDYVVCSRGGRPRLSFHIYNDGGDVERALAALGH